MTRDILEIKKGIAQARSALDLLERFIADYEGRMVNVLPQEDVVLYRADDDSIIAGHGFGTPDSLTKAIRNCAEQLAAIERG